MDERILKDKVLSNLRKSDFFCMATHEPYRMGVPDVYACKKGLSVWIELKLQKKNRLHHPLTGPQSAFLTDINKAGGLGLVLVGKRDEGVLTVVLERVTKIGVRKSFDRTKAVSLQEAIQWISDATQAYATRGTNSDTDSPKSIEQDTDSDSTQK